MFSTYLEHVSSFSVVFPLLLVLFSGKEHLKDPILLMLGILLLASSFSDAGSYVLNEMGRSNITLVNSYFITQFLVLSYIYCRVIPNKKVVYAGLILFSIFFIINTLFIEPFTEYQGWTRFAGGIMLVGFAFMNSFHLLREPDNVIPFFERLIGWINLAVVVYFLSNLFLFGVSEFLFTQLDPETARKYWSFHNCVNILKNAVFAIGIYYTMRKGADRTTLIMKGISERIDELYDSALDEIVKKVK